MFALFAGTLDRGINSTLQQTMYLKQVIMTFVWNKLILRGSAKSLSVTAFGNDVGLKSSLVMILSL